MTSPFDRWALGGWTPWLLPIIPPDGVLSARSSIKPGDAGKIPGQMNRAGHWTGFPKWASLTTTKADLARWGSWPGVGVGLRTGQVVAVDIDVTDQTVSAALASLARQKLGAAPARTGRAPKTLLLYGLAPGETPPRKMRVAFTLPSDPATVHAVEILGQGQQCVVQGIHPGTGRPYYWDQDPALSGPGALAKVTGSALEAYQTEAAKLIQVFGGTMVTGSEGAHAHTGPSSGATVDQASLRARPEVLKDALMTAGNDLSDYGAWFKVCRAIKAALGDDEAHYPIFEEWCLLYPGNTPEYVRGKWDSIHPPHMLGANYVFDYAKARGWSGHMAAVGVDALPDLTPEEAAAGLPAYLRDYVYALEQARFVHVDTRRQYTEAMFARLMATRGAGPDQRNNPAKQFFEHHARRIVDTLTYVPGGPLLIQQGAMQAVNTWTPSPAIAPAQRRVPTITDADVKPWLDHWTNIIPDARVRETFLDWQAFITQRPHIKPNWALFLGGGQGIGKGLAFRPLAEAVGNQNTRTISATELSGDWTDWAADNRLVIVEEMRNFETKHVMNKLKQYITDPPSTIPVIKKFMPTYNVPNVGCFVFMSNFPDALSLEEDDRRYYVYWSPMRAQPQSYYVNLAAWMDNPANIDAVVAWLLARDVSTFAGTVKGAAPWTASKTMMQDHGRTEFESCVIEAIRAGAAPFHLPIATLEGLWSALPTDIKRMPASGMKRLAGCLHAAGGRLLETGTGNPRRVRLDMPGGGPRLGRPRLWTLRDHDRFAKMNDDQLRTAYFAAWMPDVVTPQDLANAAE